jgi:hypothetical protein
MYISKTNFRHRRKSKPLPGVTVNERLPVNPYFKSKYQGLSMGFSGNVLFGCPSYWTPYCRKPLDHPISDSDQRRVKEFFQNCEDGSKTLYYHL